MSLKTAIDASKSRMFAGRDVPWLVQEWATKTPDKDFLVWEPFDGQTECWSFARFAKEVDAVASYLHHNGVALGDRVLIHLDNSPEFIIAWFACARMGAVAVSTNTHSVARDMIYFAEHAQVVAAITQPSFAPLVYETAGDIKFLSVTDNDAGAAADVPADVPHVPFTDLLSETRACPDRQADQEANLSIQYTSGTTSRPKAVLWTHANALWAAQMNASHMQLTHDDITLCFLPLFHTNAQSYSMFAQLWVGGTMVFQPKFSASRFWDVSLRNKCTWASTIPFCFKALSEHEIPKEHFYSFWGTAAHIPMIDEVFGLTTIGWWGMTETLTQGIIGDRSHGVPMSLGRVSPGYDIEIRRRDGSLVDPGERGNLFIRGVRGISMFKEYFHNEEANIKAFDDEGWFDTGDLIQMDEAGNLFFSDRDKDMLKVGAENVAASEIESVINASGLTQECAAVGQKHFMLDEVPVVFVIPNPGAPENLKEQIIALCKENLASFKIVRDVHIVDELPRSTLEKVAKNVLRDRLPAIEK